MIKGFHWPSGKLNTMLHIQWNLLYASLTWPRRLPPVVCSCEWDSGLDSSHPWAGVSTSNPKAGLGWAGLASRQTGVS